MKERPIIFTGEIVRAILEGRKTQTRRVKKEGCLSCKYGKIGDRLWVRETVGFHRDFDASKTELGIGLRAYKATQSDTECPESLIKKWIPAIFMPRWASRITLEITDVRVQRVQDISEADAKAEGAECLNVGMFNQEGPGYTYRVIYKELWDAINKKRGVYWQINPWVWAITFKRV